MTFEQLKSHAAVKGVEYARNAIAVTARETKQHKARLKMAEMACGKFGNYTEEAKALWAEYLAAGAPAA